MSNQTYITPAASVFILVLGVLICLPVCTLTNQDNNPKDGGYSPEAAAAEQNVSRASNSSVSVKDNIVKVTEDEKGMTVSPLERLLLGQLLVRRQANGNTDFAYCTEDHLGTMFMEPSDCQFAGENFRLCEVGKHKTAKCVEDRNKFCKYCTPDESFMSESNNCTECIPCKTCDPENEQVQTRCNIYANTVCEPKTPIGPTCPPCPVTQVVTSEETTLSTVSTSDIGSTQPYSTAIDISPVITPTCPECKCNCTDVCDREPGESASCKGYLPLHIIIIVVLLLGVIILGCRLVWREKKFIELEKKCDEERDRNVKLKLEKELAERREAPNQNRVNGTQGANHPEQNHVDRGPAPDGNISQLPLLDPSFGDGEANEPPVQSSKTQPDVVTHVDLPPSGPGSLKSIEPERTSAQLGRGDHAAGLSSRAGLLQAEVSNGRNGESSTSNFPEKYENPGMELSTLASPAPLAKEEGLYSTKLTEKSTEPSETDTFLPKQSSKTPDSGSKTDKKEKGIVKGLISKLATVKQDPSPSGASAKADKDVNRNPNGAHLSVSGDKRKPSNLHLSTKSSPKSPDAPGSLTTPLTKTPVTKTDKPELGPSPTTEGPKGLQVPVKDDKESAVSSTSESQLPGYKPSSGADGGRGDRNRQTSNGLSTDLDKSYLDEIPSDLDFEEVGSTLTPDNLRKLYRRLHINQAAIEQAEVESGSFIIAEKTVYVLRKWRNKKGKEATRRLLLEALRNCEQVHQADTLEEYFKRNKNDSL